MYNKMNVIVWLINVVDTLNDVK